MHPRLRVLPQRPPDNVDPFARRIDYLRLSLTDRCNLRCVYCMPAHGVSLTPRPMLLSFQEIWRVAAAAHAMGFTKFRITGGEPLVARDVLSFVEGLRRATGDAELAMSTNGTRLQDLAWPLRRAGVSRVNISLDTLRRERFVQMTRRDGLAAALRGVETAVDTFAKVKINAVIVRGINDDELMDLAGLAIRWPVDVRFIEQMPLDGHVDAGYLGAEHIIAALRRPLRLDERPPDDPRDAAARLWSSSMLKGRIGVIAPRSNKFCARCNRLRLTPQGELKGCLLRDGTLDVRGPLRAGLTDDGVRDLVRQAIGIKPRAYRDQAYGLDRPMSAIGG